MRACIFESGRTLKGMLILAASFVICGLSSVYGDEKAKPELEITKISSLGAGTEKIRIPGATRTRYVIGSSMERVFTVKIKNNTKEQKRHVGVKLSIYDKEAKLIGEEVCEGLSTVYAHEGYLIDEGILYPRKTVKLYFAVEKKKQNI